MNLRYYSAGKRQTLQFQSVDSASARLPTLAARASRVPAGARLAAVALPLSVAPKSAELHRAIGVLKAGGAAPGPLWTAQPHESDPRYMLTADGGTLMVATDTVVLQNVSLAHRKRLIDNLGFEVVDEGRQDKVLLRAPDANGKALEQVQAALDELQELVGPDAAVHPNFVRVIFNPKPSAAGGTPLWNHDNTGKPGIPGADVAAPAAWLITRGSKDIRVAVLDEGVDSLHPSLKAAVVDEKDFVDGHTHARPDGDDAHGTACAGIIASQDKTYPGLAPDCRLIGVRIAKGDGNNGWVFDDYHTADAIDWSWEAAKADVLSNSWGGGPPVDVIINAIQKARTKGRGGKGSVVVFAAGNSNGAVHFPASLDDVLTVGASTPWDERKSPGSKDGETWWGSCYGKELDLLAPGVRIATTDIHGKSGYDTGDFTMTFNGTSSAAPHVAAAAALVLSVNPTLTEAEVRTLLVGTCDPLVPDGKWHPEYGWGRLNIFTALRRARR